MQKEVKKTKNNIITTRLLILLIFGSLVVLCMNSASASSSTSIDHVYVNGSSGNDANDGLTPLTAKLTIKNATNTVNTGGTIFIADGTYSGSKNSNIEIDHDMTIVGAGKNKTIISGLDSSNIFQIDNGVNFILKGLTIAHGNSQFGAGMYNKGYTTIDSCVFTNCKTKNAFMGGGSAICSEDDSKLIVSNTDFISNDASFSTTGGGTIYSNGTLAMSNCTFTGNTAYNGGCVLSYYGDETFENCSFINNTASSFGGVICRYYKPTSQSGQPSTNPSDQTNIPSGQTNIPSNSQPTSPTDVYLQFCSFVGNKATTNPSYNIYNPYDSLNIDSSWWGSNDGPNGIVGSCIADNWIYMILTTNPSSIKSGKPSTVTANFNNLYNSATGKVTAIDPPINYIPDGLIVDFSSDTGQITTPGTTENGTATAVFTGTTVGDTTVKATSGYQTVSSPITVEPVSTTTTVDNAQNYPGEKIELTAHVTDENNNPVDGGYVTFTVNDEQIEVKVVNGIATLNWTIPSSWNAGIYTIDAYYNGKDTIYSDSEASGKLTVLLIPTQISSDDVTGEVGDKVPINAHLQDKFGNPLEGQKVYFDINNGYLTGTTDDNGDVTVYYTITENPGNYKIFITFGGTSQYEPSPYISKLNVNKITTSITVPDTKGAHGDYVDLQASLKDKNENGVSGKDLIFYVNGSKVGTATTKDDGTAIFSYQIAENPGIYTITALLLNNQLYQDATGKGTLTVNPEDTKITVNNINGKHGDKTNLTAVLTDDNGNPLKDKTVTFSINGVVVGKALTDSAGTATLSYTITQTIGTYTLTANFLEDDIYASSTGKGTLTVNLKDSALVVKNITAKHGDKTKLIAVLTDKNGNALAGKTITFSINGQTIGTATTDPAGTAVLYYMAANSGNFAVNTIFNGDDAYSESNGTGYLDVTPWAGLYIKTTVNNTHPKVGETFTINYKLGNNGPDTANNVVISFKIPAGLEFITGSSDNGNWSFDPLTKTITWTLKNVVVGDPNLKITFKALESGNYTIIPTISANTSTNITHNGTININVLKNNNNNTNNTNNTVNSNTNHSTKLPTTGLPIAPLIAGLLMVIGGITVKK